MTNINDQIANAFAESDAEAILDVPAAVREAREEYRALRSRKNATRYGTEERYQAEDAIKSLFSQKFISDYDWGEQEHINRTIVAVKKNHEARNARIVAKFNKAGIDSIDVNNFKVVYGKNFEGVWMIDGFRVKIEVILAGGYNIQRLHQRVLVSIKKAA